MQTGRHLFSNRGGQPFFRTCVPLVLALHVLLPGPPAQGQGCVSAPGNACSMLIPGGEGHSLEESGWTVSLGYRYFESFRHFVGDEEQPQREELGNNVINDVHTFELAGTYQINPRWSATLLLPFLYAQRSSLYEHDRTNRHTMHSAGLGDLRMFTDVWLRNPREHMKGNIALGIGFKAPTGDDAVTDTAYRATGPVLRPVDPSIQPGDGGWGIILQLQAYQQIYHSLFAYAQGSYMMTPQEQNDTEFTLGDRPGFPEELRYNTIADQYFGRAGFSYTIWPEHGLTLSLGGRVEGVPVYDAIGGSMGFRRPGYTVSIEPGVAWSFGRNALTVYAPVAMYRTRERSAPEIALGRPGGDAAFADWSILASFTHRF